MNMQKKILIFIFLFSQLFFNSIIFSMESAVANDLPIGILNEYFTDFNLIDAIKYCFKNFPEYKQGEKNIFYDKDLIDFVFGFDNFDRFINLLEKFSQTYSDRPLFYIEKSLVGKDSKIIVMGDIHSSLHSLLRNLLRLYHDGLIYDNWKLPPNTYLVFTGDYVDRGNYGLEVLLFVAKLRLKNPEKVFLLRGNHENTFLNKNFGFFKELNYKCLNILSGCFDGDILNFIINDKIFEKLPSSLFLGTKNEHDDTIWIQFCHGGIVTDDMKNANVIANEYTFMPERTAPIKDFLNDDQRSFFVKISEEEYLQYIWGSFDKLSAEDKFIISYRGAGLLFSINEVEFYCQNLHISKICHGHDHIAGGIGIFNSNFNPRIYETDQNPRWISVKNMDPRNFANERVFTFVSCPEGLGAIGINEDAYGIFTFVQNDWILRPYIFSRDDYKGLEKNVSESSENSYWYVRPFVDDRKINFRLKQA